MQGIFQYNNVLCLGMELHQHAQECLYDQRFKLQVVLPVLPVLGNTDICSTSMTSMLNLQKGSICK